MEKERQCCECRKGEHPNYDDDIKLVTVRNSETKKMVLRGYLCGEHREAMTFDGYEIIE